MIEVGAVHLPDTLRYRTTVDSTGMFTLGHIPRGSYHIFAYIDADGDNRYDPAKEIGDEKYVRVAGKPVEVEFLLPVPAGSPKLEGNGAHQ
jgi:hypothetical protein